MGILKRNALVLFLGAIPSLIAGDFFPLETGNTWTYREVTTGQGFTVTVGTPIISNGRVYYPVRGYVGGDAMARVDERGQLVYLDPEENEALLTPLVPLEGAWGNVPLRTCDSIAQAQERRGSHEGPAGRFASVLEVHYQTPECADAGDRVEQYAENIGMVRRVTTSIAGPRIFDLVSARVGRQIIEARPHATFSVTAAGIEAGFLDVALQLDLGGAQLHLDFPSSQEYEVELRDSQGAVLWRYSDGRVFTASVHSRDIFGYRAMVRIPAPGGEWPAGDYRVSAWLTTLPDAPQFATTTLVTVGRR